MGTRGDNEVALQCSVYPGRGETCAAVPQMHLCHTLLCSKCKCHTMHRCRSLNAANAGATQCTHGRILLRAQWLQLQTHPTLLSFSQFLLLLQILLFPKPPPGSQESTSPFYPTPPLSLPLIPVSSYLETITLQHLLPLLLLILPPYSFLNLPNSSFSPSNSPPLLQYPSPPNSTTRWHT